ncbi:uncharacterized protein G2W53_009440 [Senna tora]|uniref:Uncharacterized protein n=1 Tax=Senna tora TaxID=362788 RepID=A0A835C7Z8_9FABA|nr:uncharacterized protein G2W53_009440 [Senna tora]
MTTVSPKRQIYKSASIGSTTLSLKEATQKSASVQMTTLSPKRQFYKSASIGSTTLSPKEEN